jgi:hypothetical protein
MLAHVVASAASARHISGLQNASDRTSSSIEHDVEHYRPKGSIVEWPTEKMKRVARVLDRDKVEQFRQRHRAEKEASADLMEASAVPASDGDNRAAQPLACRGEGLELLRWFASRVSKCACFRSRAAIASSGSSPTCSQGRVPSASEYRRKQGPARSVGRPCTARAFAPIFALVFRPQVSDIAYHASPIPRLWPCSSSEGRTPRKETGSVFGAAACCSTSAAVRCELSRLRLWESLLPSFV